MRRHLYIFMKYGPKSYLQRVGKIRAAYGKDQCKFWERLEIIPRLNLCYLSDKEQWSLVGLC